jgi:copper(I)-binding protein
MKTLISLAVFGAALCATGSAASSIVVSNAWSRPAISTGVAYLTIANHTSHADQLIAATSPVAGSVELHESTETKGSTGSMSSMAGMSSMPGMDMSGGVASMHRVASIPIPAGGTANIAPGGYHIMLIALHGDLHANQTFPLRLHFAHAGWVVTTVHVRAM